MGPSSTYQSSFLAANSPHLHLLRGAVQTSTLEALHLQAFETRPLPDVAPHLLATVDPRETAIHTDQEVRLDPVLQDGTEHARERSRLDLAHLHEDEADMTALDATAVGGGEAQVTAATVVMMTGAEAGVVVVVVEDEDDDDIP